MFVPGLGRSARPERRRRCEQLVAWGSPAHTVGNVQYVDPRLRIGVQSSIGLDTVVARLPAGVTLGETPLGAASVLDGGERLPLPSPTTLSARRRFSGEGRRSHEQHTATARHTGHHSGCDCGSCAIAPFARNNYFTGKLLLERDFTDEQQYLRDKLRHHNQRLHGTRRGVRAAAGAAPQPRLPRPVRAARPRAPRSTAAATRSCVTAEEDIELAALPAVAGTRPGRRRDCTRSRICLTYHECGNEPVPVLYDECGCDDDRCLPNRILESYRVDAVLDPPVDARDLDRADRGPRSPTSRWPAPARVVVLDDGGASPWPTTPRAPGRRDRAR